MLGPKVAIWRSEKYRRFVASFECFGCSIESYSQCAHENAGKGRGLKTGDDRSFPLCGPRLGLIGCHTQHDLCIDMSRAERDVMARAWVEKMQERAQAAGWKLPVVEFQASMSARSNRKQGIVLPGQTPFAGLSDRAVATAMRRPTLGDRE